MYILKLLHRPHDVTQLAFVRNTVIDIYLISYLPVKHQALAEKTGFRLFVVESANKMFLSAVLAVFVFDDTQVEPNDTIE